MRERNVPLVTGCLRTRFAKYSPRTDRQQKNRGNHLPVSRLDNSMTRCHHQKAPSGAVHFSDFACAGFRSTRGRVVAPQHGALAGTDSGGWCFARVIRPHHRHRRSRQLATKRRAGSGDRLIGMSTEPTVQQTAHGGNSTQVDDIGDRKFLWPEQFAGPSNHSGFRHDHTPPTRLPCTTGTGGRRIRANDDVRFAASNPRAPPTKQPNRPHAD